MNKTSSETSSSWLEIRRLFPFLAAILLFASIALPFWSVSMTAPQYPEKNLTIRVYADKMAGDIWEFNDLNQYAGVHFPAKIPEFKFLPAVLASLGVFGLLTALAPNKVRRYLLAIYTVAMFIFLAASMGDLAYRLYHVGHDLDPNAPVIGVKPFTPPILGRNKVANFTTLSLLRSGGIAVGLAFVLNVLALWKRNTTITVRDWGRKIAAKLAD